MPLYSIIYIYLYIQDSERGYRLVLIVSNFGLNSDFIFGPQFCLRVLITSMPNRSKNFSFLSRSELIYLIMTVDSHNGVNEMSKCFV